MADFPPNLDDGELWLPSDIFPEEAPSKSITRPELAYMENLAQRFAALALLESQRNQTLAKPPPNLAPNSERFTLPVRYGSTCSLPLGCVSCNAGFGLDHGHGLHGNAVEWLWTGSRLVYQYRILSPVQPKVESFVATRPGVTQRLQNRVLPFHGSRVAVGGGGGSTRDYGGTGVFLPRIATANTTTTTGTAKITTTDVRKRQSVRNRQEIHVIPGRNTIQMADVVKQEECHYQLPPEMGLPQDWTY